MKTKVFIDGSEGTTGLRIHERLDNRDDIELLTIAPELRKDPAERSRLINSSDIFHQRNQRYIQKKNDQSDQSFK